MEIVIITGMSGAGKSSAMRALEDLDFFCIDNLPPDLLSGLLQAFHKTDLEEDEFIQTSRTQKIAIGIDIRSLIQFGNSNVSIKNSLPADTNAKIIFMEASNRTLVSRYKQSRRNHPLAKGRNLVDAITEERERLHDLREMSDFVIDTTEISLSDLKDHLYNTLATDDYDQMMTIYVQSFGFKYGLPLDSDLVIDVRFLPNPFYDEELRPLSGLDEPVKDYIMQFDQVHKFLDIYREFFEFSLPLYQNEGKVRLMISIGCTGGRHRAVAISQELSMILRSMGYRVFSEHRDIKRDPVGGI